MRDRALLLILAMSLSVGAQAQIIQQPTPPPLVTGDNASWFSLGDPVEWNGHLYYPTGTQEQFNPYQMVPDGSFRGVPLYISSVLEPGSTVFVPLSGGLMKPYQRRDTDAVASLRSMSEPMAVGTSGRVDIAPGLGAEVAKAPRRTVSTLIPPAGVNGIWVDYGGRRWFLAGKAIDYDAATLAEVGTYHGWSVYTRNGDRSTIYIPTTPGRLAPYTTR